MHFENYPHIIVDQPAPGHYVIRGHHPRNAQVEGEGVVVPLQECYITDEVPTEVLKEVIAAREYSRKRDEKRDGKTKTKAPAFEQAVEDGTIERHGSWYKYGEITLGQNAEDAEIAYAEIADAEIADAE